MKTPIFEDLHIQPLPVRFESPYFCLFFYWNQFFSTTYINVRSLGIKILIDESLFPRVVRNAHIYLFLICYQSAWLKRLKVMSIQIKLGNGKSCQFKS